MNVAQHELLNVVNVAHYPLTAIQSSYREIHTKTKGSLIALRHLDFVAPTHRYSFCSIYEQKIFQTCLLNIGDTDAYFDWKRRAGLRNICTTSLFVTDAFRHVDDKEVIIRLEKLELLKMNFDTAGQDKPDTSSGLAAPRFHLCHSVILAFICSNIPGEDSCLT